MGHTVHTASCLLHIGWQTRGIIVSIARCFEALNDRVTNRLRRTVSHLIAIPAIFHLSLTGWLFSLSVSRRHEATRRDSLKRRRKDLSVSGRRCRRPPTADESDHSTAASWLDRVVAWISRYFRCSHINVRTYLLTLSVSSRIRHARVRSRCRMLLFYACRFSATKLDLAAVTCPITSATDTQASRQWLNC